MERVGGAPYDLAVVGAGPGGYTAAIRAARRGLRTVLIEQAEAGGVCLNWGCIPTKSMLHSAALWRGLKNARRHGIQVETAACDYAAVVRQSRQTVARLVKGLELTFGHAGVELRRARARFDGRADGGVRILLAPAGGGAEEAIVARRAIVATGGRPRALPGLPVDGTRILSSREAIVLEAQAARWLIVGAGAIGLEFADLFSTFGAKVTVVEALDRILPAEDEEVSAALRSALLKRGIKIVTGAVVREVTGIDGGVRARIEPAGGEGAPGQEIEVDRVLVAVGVVGAAEALGLESLGVTLDRGFIPVDGALRTSAAELYAIGDAIGPPMLAHTASSQGVYAVEHALGRIAGDYDGRWTPGAVFTHPQVASVGLREQEAVARGLRVRVGRFPFSALGKAVAEGEVAGFVKVILEEESERLLGAHIIGPLASELIAELTLAGQHGLTASDVLRTIHTHPTLAEALPEACGAALGLGIHG